MNWNTEATYLSLPDSFYSLVSTAPAPDPELVVFNAQLALDLGLGEWAQPDLQILAGNQAPKGARVFSQAYAGHQYGHFTNLGDGRAAILGEIVDPSRSRWDIQLKGSGASPYSRRGDGKAALGPMLREYLVSEFLAAIGIPSTRSLAVVKTGEKIVREGLQAGAVLTRVAASHIRIGTFEYAAALGDKALLQALTDYTIERHFSALIGSPQPALGLWDAVATSQADLVSRWMAIGFVHGVMNTDNVALSGQAIDFGPCAFLDSYASNTTFSSIDAQGRYSYGNQGRITAWNLARFAEALLPLIDTEPARALSLAEERVMSFVQHFEHRLLVSMAAKLGISNVSPSDASLIDSLLSWMETEKIDFTRIFRDLTSLRGGQVPSPDSILPPKQWLNNWEIRLNSEQDPLALMRKSNPVYIPRNHWVEEALTAANSGNLAPFQRLLRVLQNPWVEIPGFEDLEGPGTSSDLPYVTYCGT